MKLNKIALALGMGAALFGMAQTAQAQTAKLDSVSKKITLTAQINDAMFVSKPDGSTWYGTEELNATDYKQKQFTKTLPIRIWTKNPDFNVSLAQELKMSSGKYEMKNAQVTLSSNGGDKAVAFGSTQKITQVAKTLDGYDEVHNLKIDVEAPDMIGTNSTNGSYSGDLVMVFEPVAAAAP
ncbi:CS1 type fimbrial major subunit [Burkholderia anthina]|uniref:CS1 type fimbrial major subunit n=1 Tax=Burkholderia anthina TaxID=179879 RepID=UPI000F59C539|nr:CS1 type fimbrial major subunit [Burkholderia anthina]RQV74575.1 fimbrial assembly protein [Burkholderia anthina]RQX79290.1 fimbrial assembly protein [Burkholderia anthina]